MVVIQLLQRARTPLRVALFQPRAELADGVAYATRRPEHLLNVPAGKMSLFPDEPGDFVDFLLANGLIDAPAQDLARRYVPRMHFAAYLRARLAQARADSVAQLQVVDAEVQAMVPEGLRHTLQMRDGQQFNAGQVVLAVGNALRPLPLRGANALPPTQRLEAWDTAGIAEVPVDAAVAIIGSGLSMVDSAVTLASRGHRGAIHVISRHGLLPLPHVEAAPFDFDPAPLLAMSLRARMRALRAHVADAARVGQPWQAVMERLRPMGQALWLSLGEADQRRFLRHVVRYWDVHRHRIDPGVHAQVQALRDSGQLRLHRARLDTAWAAGACVRIEGRDHDGAPLHLEVQRIINATGVEMRVQAMRSALLQQLLGEGLAAPGPHGIGIDSSPAGCVVNAAGRADPRLHVLGSLRVGSLWESLAIPELRQQAQQIALALTAPA